MMPIGNSTQLKILRGCLIAAICLIVGAISAAAYAAKARVYEVSNLTGTVWTRGPNQARWQRSWVGQLLLDGQIIQVTTGSAVTLREVVGKKDSEAGERMELRITQPLIARITPDMLRSVNVSTYFVEENGFHLTEDLKIKGFRFSLADAWQRLTAVVSGRAPQVSKKTLADLAKDGMALGSSAKKLSLLAPSMNSIVESSDWPVDLKVVWRHPNSERLKYLIYTWPSGSPRGAPLAMTEHDFYTTQLRQAGVYLVQVTSADNTWQSQGYVVHAIIPATALAKTGSANQSAPIESLRPIYPPDHTTLLTPSTDQTSVEFAWESDALGPSDFVVLNILSEAGQKVHEERTMATQLSVALPPGRYQWFLGSGQSGTLSKRRSLTILGQDVVNGNLGKSAIFKNSLRGNRSATLLLTNGL